MEPKPDFITTFFQNPQAFFNQSGDHNRDRKEWANKFITRGFNSAESILLLHDKKQFSELFDDIRIGHQLVIWEEIKRFKQRNNQPQIKANPNQRTTPPPQTRKDPPPSQRVILEEIQSQRFKQRNNPPHPQRNYGSQIIANPCSDNANQRRTTPPPQTRKDPPPSQRVILEEIQSQRFKQRNNPPHPQRNYGSQIIANPCSDNANQRRTTPPPQTRQDPPPSQRVIWEEIQNQRFKQQNPPHPQRNYKSQIIANPCSDNDNQGIINGEIWQCNGPKDDGLRKVTFLQFIYIKHKQKLNTESISYIYIHTLCSFNYM